MKKTLYTTKLLVLLVTCTFLLSSCATLFTGTTQKISITSEPSGADVVINGVNKGQTPVSVDIKKELSGQPIELKKDGYTVSQFSPTTTFNTTSILNIFFPLGFVVDALTGSLMKYNPTSYQIKLEKQKKQ